MKLIEQQLALYEEEYKKFMGTNQFPKYELQFKEVSLNVADNYGFDSVAFAAYQTQTNKHTLVVSTNLKLSKHVVFHEFTHIYDSYRCGGLHRFYKFCSKYRVIFSCRCTRSRPDTLCLWHG